MSTSTWRLPHYGNLGMGWLATTTQCHRCRSRNCRTATWRTHRHSLGLGRAVSSPRTHNNDDNEAAYNHHNDYDNDNNAIDNQLEFIEFVIQFVEFVQLEFIQLVQFIELVQLVVNNRRSPVIVTGRSRYDSSSATHTEIP